MEFTPWRQHKSNRPEEFSGLVKVLHYLIGGDDIEIITKAFLGKKIIRCGTDNGVAAALHCFSSEVRNVRAKRQSAKSCLSPIKNISKATANIKPARSILDSQSGKFRANCPIIFLKKPILAIEILYVIYGVV